MEEGREEKWMDLPGDLDMLFQGSVLETQPILSPDFGILSCKPIYMLMTAAVVIYYSLTNQPES